MTKHTAEYDRVVEAHALIELTEANVSPAADTEAWDKELSFVRRDGQDSSPKGKADDTLALSSLLA